MYDKYDVRHLQWSCKIGVKNFRGQESNVKQTSGFALLLVDKLKKYIVFVFFSTIIDLRRNPPEVRVTSGQKPSTKIIYIILQTSVGLFEISS